MSDLKVVSLFSGAGGLDYGFEAAGYDIAVTIESDADCCQTLRVNRPWAVIESDIRKIPGSRMLDEGGIKRGDLDLIIGGPPCQPFSKASYWTNGDTQRLDDSRAYTITEYMRCVEELLPSAFVLENVHGINYSGKEEGFNLIQKLTEKINKNNSTKYNISWKVLDAAEYGVPQHRVRLFLVAHRDGLRFEFPTPTHHNSKVGRYQTDLTGAKEELVTAWDAIGDLNDVISGDDLSVRGFWGDLLSTIPEGENYLWHTNRKGGEPLFGWRTRYWSFLLKLAKNRPSWTIHAQPGPSTGPFHWKSRMLSINELSRLQTFPKDIEFIGSRTSTRKQIGNAVPSLLAEVLAQEVASQFFDSRVSATPSLKVSRLHPIPAPEEPEVLQEKYKYLIGPHPDHPGTGKGVGALRRLKKVRH